MLTRARYVWKKSKKNIYRTFENTARRPIHSGASERARIDVYDGFVLFGIIVLIVCGAIVFRSVTRSVVPAGRNITTGVFSLYAPPTTPVKRALLFSSTTGRRLFRNNSRVVVIIIIIFDVNSTLFGDFFNFRLLLAKRSIVYVHSRETRRAREILTGRPNIFAIRFPGNACRRRLKHRET